MRDHRVVKSGQPVFLEIICAGTFIMASAIIPLSIDDSIASEEVSPRSFCLASMFVHHNSIFDNSIFIPLSL